MLVAVSGAWIAAVDLTPASHAPLRRLDDDNSALSLAFDYNGLGRVTGQTGGTSFGGGGGLGGAFSGYARLFGCSTTRSATRAAGCCRSRSSAGSSALACALVRRDRRRELAALTVVGGWFVAAAVVFSFSSGIIHTYYLSALAPATCALVGHRRRRALARRARPTGWGSRSAVAALGLGAWLEVDLLRRSGYLPWLQSLVIGGCAAAACDRCSRRSSPRCPRRRAGAPRPSRPACPRAARRAGCMVGDDAPLRR